MRLIAAVLATWILAVGAQAQPLPCPPKDLACAREAVKHHPVRNPDFWKAALARPLAERIGPAPAELVHFLTIDNVANEYPNRPKPSKLSPKFLADVKLAFEQIPAPIKRKLEDKLAGIYFADDIGGTGFSDEIGETGKTRLGFVILDPTILSSRTANAWATWKETSPFKPSKDVTLTATIESPADDTHANAILYILLHELGHVLSIGENIHPTWTLPPKLPKAGEFPFFDQSWTVSSGKYAYIHEDRFPQRRSVAFYFGAKLDAAAMADTYRALEATSFPTLYAATHPGDDWAESFANYIHVEVMKRPFEIRIMDGANPVLRYGACWHEARCAQKRAFLEGFLNTP